MSGSRPFQPPAFEAERFCPYHGGFIALADCQIVATNDLYNGKPTRAAAQPRRMLDDDLEQSLGAGIDDDDASLGEFAPPDLVEPPPSSRARRRMAADTSPSSGQRIESRVDGKQRLVLAGPPERPKPVQRRLFQAAPPPPTLRSPAELAVSEGGARARPARACPICRHPLPVTIDYRDPFPVAMVGHAEASKTSTVLALIQDIGRLGPEALGIDSFSPTEMTSQYLRSLDHLIFERFRDGKPPPRTQKRHHPPLEFVAGLREGRSATVLLHDVAGEDLMDPNTRMDRAPMVLWADAIVFIYNPEDSPAAKRTHESERLDQAVILNGVRDDLESRGTHDASRRRYSDPPLIVAFSKADLLDPMPAIQNGPVPEDDVKKALRSLGDGALVSAANRWPEVHWRFIAPQPQGEDASPQGVIELFRLLLSLLDR